MSNFFTFYQQGGVFMHVITLLSLGSVVLLGTRALRVRNTEAAARSRDPMLVAFLVGAAIAGALGTVFGLMETAAALQTVPAQHWGAAFLRAAPLALTPLAWGLLSTLPLTVARGVVASAERGTRPPRTPATA